MGVVLRIAQQGGNTILEGLRDDVLEAFGLVDPDVRIAGELASFGLDRFASDLGRPVIELDSVEQRLLSIVRAVSTVARLVTRLGGSVRFEAPAEGGTTVRLTLRAAEDRRRNR